MYLTMRFNILVSSELKDCAFLWGNSKLLLLQCTTYQLSCHCFRMCYVCVRNWSDRFPMWQLFSKVTDAIGRNGKAIDRVCVAYIINPNFCSMAMTIPIWMPIHIQPYWFQLGALFTHLQVCNVLQEIYWCQWHRENRYSHFYKKNFSMYCILL